MASPEQVQLTTGAPAPAPEARFLGIRPIDWLKTTICLIILYICTACVFFGLMSVASQVRQEEWLSLPSNYFGDFVKIEFPTSFMDETVGFPEEWQLHYTKSNKNAKWNRAEGCHLLKDSTEWACFDQKDWNVYPWIVDANPTGCARAASELDFGDGYVLDKDSGVAGNYATFATFSDLGLWTGGACMNAAASSTSVVTFTTDGFPASVA